MRDLVLERWPVALEAVACRDSALVPSYLGPDHPDPASRDALAFTDWADLVPVGGVVFLNPPYVPVATLSAFLSRDVATAEAGCEVVALLPASTGAGWWEHIVERSAQVEFLRGRLSFDGPLRGRRGRSDRGRQRWSPGGPTQPRPKGTPSRGVPFLLSGVKSSA